MKFDTYFGGPDRPRGYLRDILAERVAAVPPGGEIDWVTYYFRDRRLAEDLLRARRRGVRVRITLEADPRIGHANDRVLAMLAGPEGLGDGLRTVTHRRLPGMRKRPHLHEKLYCFSQPTPTALVGSFNPSGNEPEEEPAIIDEILDQDRGHNVLVAINDRHLVDGLVRHARTVHKGGHGVLERFNPATNKSLHSAQTTILFWPRVGPNPLSRFLRRFGRGTRVRVAASHIRGRGVTGDFTGLVRRGANVELLTESTELRVPPLIEAKLASGGVQLTRFRHPENLPMHNKFVLIEDGAVRWTVFGSYNWTARSRWHNHEIGVITRDQPLFDIFAARWDTMMDMAA